MKKKVVSVLLAAAMTTTLVAGCGSTGAADTAADTSAEETTESTDDTEADAADAEETANAGATYKVAVVKQMDHASLDEIANAVEEELDAIAAKNGVTIEYETYSGQGDQSTLTQIGTQAVADGVDAIIPIATLAAQVMATCAEDTQTPVVYAAISDPEAAELTGIDYVTGTSDALNTTFIMDMMLAQNPDVQKVGLLYSLSEANSTKPIADAKAYLDEKGIEYKDYGCDSLASVDYPVYAKKVAHAILDGECEKGILICGTGIGISITANKIRGIRAAVCTDCFTAEATRLHNDANILALGGRVVGPGLAVKIVETFLNTPFSNDERHIRRINQIETE